MVDRYEICNYSDRLKANKCSITSFKDAEAVELADSDTPTLPSCRLLELPAELRNRIYELALAKSIVLPIWWNTRILAPLTILNHQIRRESLPIHYGINRFRIYVEWEAGISIERTFGPLVQYVPYVKKFELILCAVKSMLSSSTSRR